MNDTPTGPPSATSTAPLTPADLSGAVRLTEWGVIRALGSDAAKFLHGQLTQDTEHIGPADVRLAGFCSPKGRLLASFVIWRPTPDELLLACSADLLPTALKRLQMFVMRAKCKLSDATAELPLWGVAGTAVKAAADSAATAGARLLSLPHAQAEGQVVPRGLWVGGPPAALPELAADTWRWLEVKSGVARVVAATVEQFVPQMVNLELVGGVNFQKGCYPGQEVVARMQYRGTLKRRAFVLTGPQPMRPGEEVFSAEDPSQPAGMVVLSGTRRGAEHAALVELKIAAFEAAALHLGAADGPPLGTAALPYAFPVEAA
jgi:tRNA-modifying protein YgfZ